MASRSDCGSSEEECIAEYYRALDAFIARFRSQNTAARTLGISSATLTRATAGWISQNSPKNRPARPQAKTLLSASKSKDARLAQAAARLIELRGLQDAQPDSDPIIASGGGFQFERAGAALASIGLMSLHNIARTDQPSDLDIEHVAALDLLTTFINAHYSLVYRDLALLGREPVHPFGLSISPRPDPYSFRHETTALYDSDDTHQLVRQVLDEFAKPFEPIRDDDGTVYEERHTISIDAAPAIPLLRLIQFKTVTKTTNLSDAVLLSIQSQALEQELVALAAARRLVTSISAEYHAQPLYKLSLALQAACENHLQLNGRAFLQAWRGLLEYGALPGCEEPIASTYDISCEMISGVREKFKIWWRNDIIGSCLVTGIEAPFRNQRPSDL